MKPQRRMSRKEQQSLKDEESMSCSRARLRHIDAGSAVL